MSKVLLVLAEMPACIRDSMRACLAAHGLKLDEPLLIEISNNVAQGLVSLDDGDDVLERLAALQAKLDALAALIPEIGRAIEVAWDPSRRGDPATLAWVESLAARLEAAMPRTKA